MLGAALGTRLLTEAVRPEVFGQFKLASGVSMLIVAVSAQPLTRKLQMNDGRLLDFSNKVILVTGASRGIGEATARLMAAEGGHVIVSSRRKESVDIAAPIFDNLQALSKAFFTIYFNNRSCRWQEDWNQEEAVIKRAC